MIYSDMHTHTRFSDGKGEPIEFALAALDKGIGSLGFSDHSPIPKPNKWSMKLADLNDYIAVISRLKEDFRDRLDIYLGIELDYVPGMDVKGYIGFDSLPIDYYLGSVHYIYAPGMKKNKTVDGSPEKFRLLIDEGFGGDVKAVYRAYYENVRQMISTYRPEIVAHVDLITKFNSSGQFFSTDEPEYTEEVDSTLAVVKEYGAILELNSGGMSRGYMNSPYPSEYILKKCIEMNIPVTLNSDAHSSENLSYEFNVTAGNIKAMGFSEIMVYKDGRWVPARL